MINDLPAVDLQMCGMDGSIQDASEQKNRMWGLLLRGLEDEVLLESYQHAVKLMLEQDFIDLLREELQRRGIDEECHVTEYVTL